MTKRHPMPSPRGTNIEGLRLRGRLAMDEKPDDEREKPEAEDDDDEATKGDSMRFLKKVAKNMTAEQWAALQSDLAEDDDDEDTDQAEDEEEDLMPKNGIEGGPRLGEKDNYMKTEREASKHIIAKTADDAAFRARHKLLSPAQDAAYSKRFPDAKRLK